MDTLIRKPSSRSRYAWRISGALSRAKAGSVSDAGKGIAAPVCEYQLICASPVQIQKRDFKYHGMIPHILWTCRQRLPSSNQTTL